MSDAAFDQLNSSAWPQRLVRLLLIAAFCLTGMAAAHADAELDPDAHKITVNTALPTTLAADTVHQWDPDAPIPARLVIKRIYTTWLSPAADTANQAQRLAGFLARAPPSPHLQSSVC